MSFPDKRFSSEGLLLTKELFCAARWGSARQLFSTFFGFSRAEVDRQNLLGVRENCFEGTAVSLRLARSCGLEIATRGIRRVR